MYPAFLGHCTSAATLATNWSDAAYIGADYGLDAYERQLLPGGSLPAGSRLYNDISTIYPGSPYTLTLMLSYACAPAPAPPYAIVFAEQSLDQVTAALAGLVDGSASVSSAFIVERATGYVVAASKPGQVAGPIDANGKATRVLATSAPDGAVSGAAGLLAPFASSVSADAAAVTTVESGSLWVAASSYSDANLDWVLVTVIPKTTFLQDVAQASALSIGLSIAVVVVGTALVVSFVYCCITLPLARLRDSVVAQDRRKLVGGDDGGEVGGASSFGGPAGGEPAPAATSNIREINDLAQSLAAYSSRNVRAAAGGGRAL